MFMEIESELSKLKKRWMDRVKNDTEITSVSKEVMGGQPFGGVGKMQREIIRIIYI